MHSGLDGNNHTQHNPQTGNGLSRLDKALDALAKQGIMKYERIHSAGASGHVNAFAICAGR